MVRKKQKRDTLYLDAHKIIFDAITNEGETMKTPKPPKDANKQIYRHSRCNGCHWSCYYGDEKAALPDAIWWECEVNKAPENKPLYFFEKCSSRLTRQEFKEG